MPLDVMPAAGATPPAAPAPEPSAGPDLSQIPLEDPNFDPMTVPMIRAIAEAEVPGVVLSEQDLARPELEPIAKNGRAIFEKTPVSLYRGKSGIVFFNPGVIKPEEVAKLDAAGKLAGVLAPASQFLGGDGAGKSPVEAPSSPLPALGGVAGPSMAPPMSGSAQRRLAGVRGRATAQPNLPPTRQPVPAGGSLLNQFVRSPV